MRAGASNTHGAFPVSDEIDALIDGAHRAGADFLGCDRDEVVFGQNATSLLLHVSRSFSRTLRPRRRGRRDAPGPRRERPAVGAGGARRGRRRPVGRRARGRRHAGPSTRSTPSSPSGRAWSRSRSRPTPSARSRPRPTSIARAKAVGALVAVDGVHAAQHRLIDLHGLGADLVATSPYKFFGPHQGMLGVRRELLDAWEPYKLRPVEDVNPDRWETGTQSHEAMAGTVAAIDYIAGAAGGGSDAARRDRGVVRRVRGPRTRALPTVPRRRRGDRAASGWSGSPTLRAWTSARRRSPCASASSRPPRPRARWPMTGHLHVGRATTTRSRSSTGSGSSRPVAPCGSASATTTRSTRCDRVLDALEVVGRRS